MTDQPTSTAKRNCDGQPSLAPVPCSANIALYRTSGNREAKHCCVLYLAANKDWGSIQLTRNGSQWPALAVAPMTPEAEAYRSERHRASSLQYNGKEPADAEGLAADLRSFGYDEATVQKFVDAAKPCWPNR